MSSKHTPHVARLIIDDSRRNADLLYATKFHVSDPVIYIEDERGSALLLGSLEIGRAHKQARVDRIVSIEELAKRYEATRGPLPLGRSARRAALIGLYAEEGQIEGFSVQHTFPLAAARDLEELGFDIALGDEIFTPERLSKREEEIDAIAAVMALTDAVLERAIDRIGAARIEGDVLVEGGAPLTSEAIKEQIAVELLARGALAEGTIVAGGDQAVDAHHRGTGPLPAHRPIILDVFPRDMESGYFCDVTRTVLRGDLSEALAAQWSAVVAAHDAAVAAARPGASCRDVHLAAAQAFVDRGFETTMTSAAPEGFVHSTGHGVGLEIHEPPSLSALSTDTLAPGMVVTIEPGLYYGGRGGMRLENLFLVEDAGLRRLSTSPAVFHLG